jgi:hypothetical protein
MMIVDSSYVTKRWVSLEQNRKMLRLMEKAKEMLEELALRQEQVISFIFAEFKAHEVADLVSRLSVLASRLEKARIKATVEPWISLTSEGPSAIARGRFEEAPQP